jgi:hypothetical protein
MLNALYNDETTGLQFNGTYYGQVYVAAGSTVPKISVGPSILFEGENASITASIVSPDGKEVTNGIYSALVYPEAAQGDYSSLMHSTYSAFALVPLTFDAKIDLWTASVTMPSPYNSSLASSTNANAEYYGGPYEVYVSGLSAGGVPTTAALSAQQGFYVQPYVYSSNSVSTDPQQTSRLALSNATINAGSTPLALADDYFVGNNTVTGSDVTITSSTVSGTLHLENGQTTLNGVTGGNVVATNTHVVLEHSSLSSLTLGAGATASIDSASSYQSVTPALPVVTISSPTANASYTGSLNAQVAVTGSGVAAVTFMLDGKALPPIQGNNTGPQISYQLNTTSMPDGTHTLTVTAAQADLLTTTASVSFVTHNQLASLTNGLATANKSLSAANGDIADLKSTIGNLTYLLYLAVVVAVVGVALAVYAIRTGKAPYRY